MLKQENIPAASGRKVLKKSFWTFPGTLFQPKQQRFSEGYPDCTDISTVNSIVTREQLVECNNTLHLALICSSVFPTCHEADAEHSREALQKTSLREAVDFFVSCILVLVQLS